MRVNIGDLFGGSGDAGRFHFRHDPGAALPRKDLEAGFFPQLALAARATASFIIELNRVEQITVSATALRSCSGASSSSGGARGSGAPRPR